VKDSQILTLWTTIAFMEYSWKDMIELISKVEEETDKVGLHIDADKTELMTVGKCATSQIVNTGNKVVSEL